MVLEWWLWVLVFKVAKSDQNLRSGNAMVDPCTQKEVPLNLNGTLTPLATGFEGHRIILNVL